MTWVRIDDKFAMHPKVAALDPGLRAFAIELHLAGLCYCAQYLTDGLVPAGQVTRLADFSAHGVDVASVAGALVRVGLWERAPGGHAIHDYLQYNPSRARVEKEREAWKERQAKSRDASRRDSDRDTEGVTP
jgi:hypothetical protein